MNNIKDAFDSIAPTDEQRERMLSRIKKRAASPARRSAKWLRVAAIAAVLCCVFTMSVFAEEITVFIAGIFTDDAIVGDTVRTSVYTDTDGHVEMTVEEVLSDLSTVRIVVHYRALDDVGSDWLSSLSFLGDDPEWFDEKDRYCLRFEPVITSPYDPGGANDAHELDAYHTDSERRFLVFMELSTDDWGSEARLSYSMTDGRRDTLIDVSTNIEKRVYTLDSVQNPEKPYRPTSVKLSPLTITVYGDNLGAFRFVEYETTYGWYSSITALSEERMDSMSVIFNDGTKIVLCTNGCPVTNMSMFGIVPETEDPNDCMIVTMSFDEPINPDSVSGIEIDGVFYSFE